MNYPSLLLPVLLTLFSCSDPAPAPVQKKLVEISHPGEYEFSTDTLLLDGNMMGLPVSLSLRAVPDHFVAASLEKDSTIEMHLWPDKQIQVELGGKSFIINKDSLKSFVTADYLNEALITGCEVVNYDVTGREISCIITVKKPTEDFAFRFMLNLSPSLYQIQTVDE